MAITGSPSVFIIEQDLTNYDTITSVTNAAMVGDFEWGPINKITPVKSTAKLVETFGYPNDDNYKDWFTAYNFLQYSGNLYAVRVRDKQGTLKTEGAGTSYFDFEKTSNSVLATPSSTLGSGQAWVSNVVIENADYFDGMDIADFTKRCAIGKIAVNTESGAIESSGTVTGIEQVKPFAVARYAGSNGNKFSVYFLDYEHCYNNFSYVVKNKEKDLETPYVVSCTSGTSAGTEDPSKFIYTDYRTEYYAVNTATSGTSYGLYKGTRTYKTSETTKTYSELGTSDWTRDDTVTPTGTVLINDNYSGGVYSFLGTQKLKEDEVAVAVYYEDKVFESGVFSISENSVDSNGFDNNLFTAFNNSSNSIYLIKSNYKEVADEIFDNTEQVLIGGNSGTTNSSDNAQGWMDAIDILNGGESEYTNISLFMQAGATPDIGNYYINLCNTKKDALVCVSPQQSEILNKTADAATKCLTNKNNTLSGYGTNCSISKFTESSYAFMDGNYKYQYDAYNACYRWVPLNGDIAGLFAQIDTDENPWMSIGNHAIKNCVKLAFYPNKDQRDELFYANINPVINIPSKGNVVYGDWTFQNNTVFNFVGVRRCFLYMENYIKQIAYNILFKQNDEITNTEFVQSVDPFLAGIVGGRGISEYKIYSGSTITSQEDMDKGIFRAKILIKPIRSIRYVELTFSAVRSDVNIDEVI